MPDVFLSHVGADKETYVRPLAEALMASGFTFWIDEAELRWGDSLMERISEGLHQSRCVIIFLSREFLERRWTRRELMWAMAIQDVEEGHKLLPLYIEDPSEVWKTYPIISHIRYLT
ncbi:MAG: toll/interleukin-1 receptor domain-containing protein, partial [Armatimonadia bacterium]